MDRLTSKLTEQREAHADRTNLSGEDLRNVQVHGSVTASTFDQLAYKRGIVDRKIYTNPWKAKYR